MFSYQESIISRKKKISESGSLTSLNHQRDHIPSFLNEESHYAINEGEQHEKQKFHQTKLVLPEHSHLHNESTDNHVSFR